MTGVQVFKTLLSVIIIGLLAFCVYWVIANKNTVEAVFNGANIYTQADIDEAFNKGVESGDKTNAEHEELIQGLREELTQKDKTISDLQAEIEALTAFKGNGVFTGDGFTLRVSDDEVAGLTYNNYDYTITRMQIPGFDTATFVATSTYDLSTITNFAYDKSTDTWTFLEKAEDGSTRGSHTLTRFS